MSLEKYDRIIGQAFSFLVDEFGYSSQPVQSISGHFGPSLFKAFTKDRRTITLVIGDIDSSVFCDVLFSDGEDEQVEPERRHFRYRSLYFLLRRKSVKFELPDKRCLNSDASRADALVACANLVREHAVDVVRGDFSAFPQLVYVVRHTDRRHPTGEIQRLIGVYSSLSAARKAISERRIKPGFVVRQDGFEVDCFELDQGLWTTGIEIGTSDQASDLFMRALTAASLAEFDAEERSQLEAQWLSKFSAFQESFEVSRAAEYADGDAERDAILARYPRDHIAWSSVVDRQQLQRTRSVFVEELLSRPIAIECWKKWRDSGALTMLSAPFVDFIEAELKLRA